MSTRFHRQWQEWRLILILMNIRHGTHHFSKFQPQAIFEAQHKISEILINYFEESNRTKRQKQSYYYATERWRDIKIALMDKLANVKSTLRSQLSDELCKPITDHKSFVEIRDSRACEAESKLIWRWRKVQGL